jgi:glycosyltransferase involved in cell wall biosynthesis
MTVTPKLAVVIPVYNEFHTLEAIVAKLAQLPFPIEMIAVDDASTDGTRAVAQRLADTKKIQLICHDHNRGKGAAIRSAFGASAGARRRHPRCRPRIRPTRFCGDGGED